MRKQSLNMCIGQDSRSICCSSFQSVLSKGRSSAPCSRRLIFTKSLLHLHIFVVRHDDKLHHAGALCCTLHGTGGQADMGALFVHLPHPGEFATTLSGLQTSIDSIQIL